MMTHINRLLLAVALTLPVGCAASRAQTEATRSLDDRLLTDRQVLTQLRGGKYAEHALGPIEQAGLWLARAETLHAAEDPDRRELNLLVEVIEAQLARIKADYARLAAEAEMARRRGRYETLSHRLRTSRRERSALNEEAP